MAKIYTKMGDDGTTGLIGGERVSKDSARIAAYGSVDELNAVLGLVRSCPIPERLGQVLERVQDDLFIVGALLAVPPGTDSSELRIPAIEDEDVVELERRIDELEAELEPLRQFIIPGGTRAGAMLHVARTVARRAERCCVTLARTEKVDARALAYLNRLSDLLFMMARLVNRRASAAESHPTFRGWR